MHPKKNSGMCRRQTEPEISEEGAAMKPHCLPGRHKWRVDNGDPDLSSGGHGNT
jgi:hypothetical protein